MAESLKKLSEIDNRVKYAVYGWIRKAEQELKIQYIPSRISWICILYYHENEIFDVIGPFIELSNDKKSISGFMDENAWSTNYGITEISSISNTVCRWDLRIEGYKPFDKNISIVFGISSITTPYNYFEYVKETESGLHYCYDGGDGTIYDNEGQCWSDFGRECSDGIVSICLDLEKEQMKFLINDNDEGIAYKSVKKGEDIKYRLMISLDDVSDFSVEILNFTTA